MLTATTALSQWYDVAFWQKTRLDPFLQLRYLYTHLGVKRIHTPNGMTKDAWDEALDLNDYDLDEAERNTPKFVGYNNTHRLQFF